MFRTDKSHPLERRSILRRLLSRFRCRHQNIPIAAQAVMHHEGVVNPYPVHTVMLQRCQKCGLHSTAVLMGHWSMAELLRKESDLAALEAMVAQ